jgi:hypothetical protein
MKSLNALVVAILLSSAASAQTASEFGLLNTGALRADGSNPYSLTATSVGGTYGLYIPSSSAWPINGVWLDNSSNAQWLAIYSGATVPSSGSDIPTVAAGNYTVSLSFDLGAFSASDVSFEVLAAADNNLSVALNSNALANLGSAAATVNYDNLTHYRYLVGGSALQSGVNTLEFTVSNAAGTSGNPAGLYVAYSNLAVIPEPSTYALLLGVGTLILAAFSRHLRR